MEQSAIVIHSCNIFDHSKDFLAFFTSTTLLINVSRSNCKYACRNSYLQLLRLIPTISKPHFSRFVLAAMLTICTRLLNSHICPYKALFTKLCNNGRGPFEMYYHRYKKGLDWLKKSEIRKKSEKCKRAENPNTVPWLLIDWLFNILRPFQEYFTYIIAGEGLQNLSLCSALRAFE